jgi:hypothetical protein
MFNNFFPNQTAHAQRFVQALRQTAAPVEEGKPISKKIGEPDSRMVPLQNVTTARLQGHFLKYKDMPEEAVQNAEEVFQHAAYE